MNESLRLLDALEKSAARLANAERMLGSISSRPYVTTPLNDVRDHAEMVNACAIDLALAIAALRAHLSKPDVATDEMCRAMHGELYFAGTVQQTEHLRAAYAAAVKAREGM